MLLEKNNQSFRELEDVIMAQAKKVQNSLSQPSSFINTKDN
jgi:hypothetical protein